MAQIPVEVSYYNKL